MYVSWTNYTARMTAAVVKEVTCEKCRVVFLYAVERSETGMGTSVYGVDDQGAQERAAGRAAENLRGALDNAFEAVPCPSCGAYQAQMVEYLKRIHLKWLLIPALLVIFGSIAGFFGSFLSGSTGIGIAAAVGLVIGVGLIAYRRLQADKLDPNDGNPEPRIQLGKSIAILKKDLPASQAESAPPENSVRSRRRGGR